MEARIGTLTGQGKGGIRIKRGNCEWRERKSAVRQMGKEEKDLNVIKRKIK
jgi:hypothetical protein